jgi:transposase
MMTRRQGLLALEDWLTRVEADDQPELHSLAAGIRRDQEAVTAGLALPYSSGAMEGNVNMSVTWNHHRVSLRAENVARGNVVAS